MATVQDLKRRIRSVRNTRKITRAMELVAAAKLRRAEHRITALRPYAETMSELIAVIRCSARRSLAAATSSIARVIFRVLRTERIRRLRSWTVAMRSVLS